MFITLKLIILKINFSRTKLLNPGARTDNITFIFYFVWLCNILLFFIGYSRVKVKGDHCCKPTSLDLPSYELQP